METQGIPIKSGEFIAKSDVDRCTREVCNYGVVCFPDLKDGKRFVVFEKVIHFVPDQHVSVFSKCQVKSLLIIIGQKELLRGDGFACKINQVFYPVITFTRPFDRPESAWVNKGVLCTAKKRGEEARGFSTVRGPPQNGDGRTCVRQAEPQEIL